MKHIPFCEKCSKLLQVKKGKDSSSIGVCECGFTKILPHLQSTEKIKKKEKVGEGIEEDSSSSSGFPHTCKKCGYGECEIYDLGAAYSDESNILLYQCKKCNFVERQADGTGNS